MKLVKTTFFLGLNKKEAEDHKLSKKNSNIATRTRSKGASGNITQDGLKVWGLGVDAVAGSGDSNGDRGSGSIDADTSAGDASMLFEIGLRFVSPSLNMNFTLINILTPNTPFTGENEASAKAGTTAKIVKVSEPVIEKVTLQRYNYTSSDTYGGNTSYPHAGKPRDTSVVRGNESAVNKLNTRDSLRAAEISNYKNAESKRRLGY